MKWISVKDRLPTGGDYTVLAVVNGKCNNMASCNAIEMASYSSDDGWILEAYPKLSDMQVTHWMPLPELPEITDKQEE